MEGFNLNYGSQIKKMDRLQLDTSYTFENYCLNQT